MVHAIFCAHGQLAGAMLDSVRMVYGEVNVSAVAFVPGENAADIAINPKVSKRPHRRGVGHRGRFAVRKPMECRSRSGNASPADPGD